MRCFVRPYLTIRDPAGQPDTSIPLWLGPSIGGGRPKARPPAHRATTGTRSRTRLDSPTSASTASTEPAS
jgi:hypothetical protein